MTVAIRKGSTYRVSQRWEQNVIQYVPITDVSSAAPVVITAVGHGMPDGWRFSISGVVGGGSALNSKHNPPKNKDYFNGAVLSSDTIEINSVNGSGWKPYTSGGVLQYNLPVNFTGATAKAQARKYIGGDLLFELTTAGGGIVLTNTGNLTYTILPVDTTGITVDSAVFDIEITLADGSVLAFPKETIVFSPEVTL